MAKEQTVRVMVLKSFGASLGGKRYRGIADQELDMPADADWIKAGLCTPVGAAAKASGAPRETAALAPEETATAPEAKPPTGKGRTAKKSG
jgi:hypothetical protein